MPTKRTRRLRKRINLAHAERQLKTVLVRELEHLLDISYANNLDSTALKSVAECAKLLTYFQQKEAKEESNLTDEELEAITK